MKEKTILILCGMLCITFLAWGILLWPTLYRYDKTDGKVVRINKLTGYIEVLGGKKAKIMPQDEKNKVEVRGRFDLVAYGTLKPLTGSGFVESIYEANIYNGTSWTIRKIRLSIGGKHKTGEIEWQRTYETFVDIAPFSRGYCRIKLMDSHILAAFKDKMGTTRVDTVDLSPDIKIEQVVGYESE